MKLKIEYVYGTVAIMALTMILARVAKETTESR